MNQESIIFLPIPHFSSWLNFIELCFSFFLKFLCFLLVHYFQGPYRTRSFSEVFELSYLTGSCSGRLSVVSGYFMKQWLKTNLFIRYSFLDNSLKISIHCCFFFIILWSHLLLLVPGFHVLWSVSVPYQNWGIFIFVVL